MTKLPRIRIYKWKQCWYKRDDLYEKLANSEIGVLLQFVSYFESFVKDNLFHDILQHN